MASPKQIKEIQPARSATPIEPNDTTKFTRTRGVYVAVSGDLRVGMANGAVLTFTSIAAGIIHPLSVTRVLLTGTTATGIIGLF